MPSTKNATARYIIINRCLTSKVKKHWSVDELINQIGEKDIRINRRMLMYDIDAMRGGEGLGYHAPIEYCKRNKGYYYTDPEFSIESISLSEEQWKSFDTVMSFLYEHRDLKIMRDFHSAIDKLSGVMSQFRNPTSTPFLMFEKAPFYKGLELRDGILEAIRGRQVLMVKYTTFGRSFPIKHTIHPYLLKEYKNRWYVIGLLESKKKPITLALDRIDQFSSLNMEYLENTHFDPEEYFSNFLGVTYTEGAIEEVELKVTPFLANYLKTQHIHASQEVIKEDKEGMYLRLRLIPNHELMAVLLSHGKEVQVLNPSALREQIKENLSAAFQQYR
jgi:predicted DNA-binding transcriptional regulator YafY